MKTVDDFDPGDIVLYLGDTPSEETGIVTGKNLTFVFVKFSVMATNGMACNPGDLELLLKRPQ